jgi:hypothetical protein
MILNMTQERNAIIKKLVSALSFENVHTTCELCDAIIKVNDYNNHYQNHLKG